MRLGIAFPGRWSVSMGCLGWLFFGWIIYTVWACYVALWLSAWLLIGTWRVLAWAVRATSRAITARRTGGAA